MDSLTTINLQNGPTLNRCDLFKREQARIEFIQNEHANLISHLHFRIEELQQTNFELKEQLYKSGVQPSSQKLETLKTGECSDKVLELQNKLQRIEILCGTKDEEIRSLNEALASFDKPPTAVDLKNLSVLSVSTQSSLPLLVTRLSNGHHSNQFMTKSVAQKNTTTQSRIFSSLTKSQTNNSASTDRKSIDVFNGASIKPLKPNMLAGKPADAKSVAMATSILKRNGIAKFNSEAGVKPLKSKLDVNLTTKSANLAGKLRTLPK